MDIRKSMFTLCFFFLICISFYLYWEIFGFGLFCGLLLAVCEQKSSKKGNEGEEIAKEKQILKRDDNQQTSDQHTDIEPNQNDSSNNSEDETSLVISREQDPLPKEHIKSENTVINIIDCDQNNFEKEVIQFTVDPVKESTISSKTLKPTEEDTNLFLGNKFSDGISAHLLAFELNSLDSDTSDYETSPIIISEEIKLQNKIIKSMNKQLNITNSNQNLFGLEAFKLEIDDPLTENNEEITPIIISDEIALQRELIKSMTKVLNLIDINDNSFGKEVLILKADGPVTENNKSAETLTPIKKDGLPPVPETFSFKKPNSKFKNFKTRLLSLRIRKKSRPENETSSSDFVRCGDTAVRIEEGHVSFKKKKGFRCWGCVPCK